MLHCPDVVDTEAIGQNDLVDGVGQQLFFVAVGPRLRQLMFVEDPKSHP